MKIVLGGDHAGFELKDSLKEYLENLGYDTVDKGPFSFVPNDDYPDYTIPVAKEVLKDQLGSRGVIIGGSGQGEAISVNRLKGIRAAVYYGGDLNIIKLSREHNDANILSLGARFINGDEAKLAVKLWLETAFGNEERHVRRLQKIEELA